jgi:hypothetical protein
MRNSGGARAQDRENSKRASRAGSTSDERAAKGPYSREAEDYTDEKIKPHASPATPKKRNPPKA